jgi:hypothetical protein
LFEPLHAQAQERPDRQKDVDGDSGLMLAVRRDAANTADELRAT